jgi:hypothetical protein
MAFSKAASVDYNYRSDDSASEKPTKQAEPAATGNAATNTKRKYRRHPKVGILSPGHHVAGDVTQPWKDRATLTSKSQPDENAPERPPSAYVIFSNRAYHPNHKRFDANRWQK